MVPNLILSFLNLCQPSYGHHRGPKVLPWDPQRLIFKHSIMSIRCQNFSSIGSIGQKLGVFSIRALKTTPLRPLRVMDQFLDNTLSIRYKRNPFLVQGSISLIFSKIFSQISLKNSPILKTLRVHSS